MKTYEQRREDYLAAGNDFWAITDHEEGLDSGSECWYSVGDKKFSSRREAAEFLFSEFESKNENKMKNLELAYKSLVKASNEINDQKCKLYNVKNTRDCDYSLLSDNDKKQADFLDIIEQEIDNALSFIKLEIYGN
jgi:hypothetical protein